MSSFVIFLYILLNVNQLLENSQTNALKFKNDENCKENTCFPQFGCFSTKKFKNQFKNMFSSKENFILEIENTLSLKERLSICPMNPNVMNISFLFFTKDLETVFQYNSTKEEINASGFSADKRTVFIVHGYTDHYSSTNWMAAMKDYWLQYNENVFAVDWRKPADQLDYFNSAFNTQIVGSVVAFFINNLINWFGAKPQEFHLIGHSLGAHVVGFAGKRFNATKLGYISGLDPAGPGFWLNDSETRLAPTDASLVIVTHTSSGIFKYNGDEDLKSKLINFEGFLGNPEPFGHYDFRPNGGTGQTGCPTGLLIEIKDELKGNGSCDHDRATLLPVADRLLKGKNSCQLIGYLCKSYDTFTKGLCADCGSDGHKCRPLEFDPEFWLNPNNSMNSLKTFPNNYYLLTSGVDPYCLFHYQIVIYIEENSGLGSLKMTLKGVKTEVFNIDKPLLGFRSGHNYTQLIAVNDSLGEITEAVVDYGIDIFDKTLPLILKITKIDINFMSNLNNEIRQKFSTKLFPENSKYKTFIPKQTSFTQKNLFQIIKDYFLS